MNALARSSRRFTNTSGHVGVTRDSGCERCDTLRTATTAGRIAMADLDKALATQLANIEKRTGKTVAELIALVRGSGLAKHGEKVAMLKSTLGMGHGDANTVVHLAAQSDAGADAAPGAAGDPLDALYVGAKAALRPIHERLLAAMATFDSMP